MVSDRVVNNMEKFSKFTVFDFETCGLQHPIFAVSLGFIYYENFKKVHSDYILINPEHPISQAAYYVHKISEKMVKDKPNFPTVWKEIKKYFAPDVLLIGHNVKYDVSVLKDNLEFYNIDYHGEINSLCTCDNAKNLISKNEVKNYKLDTLCDYFGITLDDHHNAFADVIACKNLFNCLIKENKNFCDFKIKQEQVDIG